MYAVCISIVVCILLLRILAVVSYHTVGCGFIIGLLDSVGSTHLLLCIGTQIVCSFARNREWNETEVNENMNTFTLDL